MEIYEFQSTEQQVQGVLNLIDLAGSERLAKSGSTGDRLKETQVNVFIKLHFSVQTNFELEAFLNIIYFVCYNSRPLTRVYHH